MKAQWTAVDEYIDRSLVKPDAALDFVLEASAAAGLPRLPCAALNSALPSAMFGLALRMP